jgi:hypothetical protein
MIVLVVVVTVAAAGWCGWTEVGWWPAWAEMPRHARAWVAAAVALAALGVWWLAGVVPAVLVAVAVCASTRWQATDA